MAAVAASLRPACGECAGGGEINGLACRACDGSGRAAVLVRLAGLRRWLHGWSLTAAGAAGVAVRWSAALPGVAGAAGVTLGVAMIAHGVWPRLPEMGVGLLAGGVFALAADRRL